MEQIYFLAAVAARTRLAVPNSYPSSNWLNQVIMWEVALEKNSPLFLTLQN